MFSSLIISFCLSTISLPSFFLYCLLFFRFFSFFFSFVGRYVEVGSSCRADIDTITKDTFLSGPPPSHDQEQEIACVTWKREEIFFNVPVGLHKTDASLVQLVVNQLIAVSASDTAATLLW